MMPDMAALLQHLLPLVQSVHKQAAMAGLYFVAIDHEVSVSAVGSLIHGPVKHAVSAQLFVKAFALPNKETFPCTADKW